MPNLAHLAIKVLAGIAGLFSLYAAVFLYEDEAGKVQNKLEEWWVRVSDQQRLALSVQARFIGVLSSLATKGLDRVFGQDIVSWRAVAASTFYSFASLNLFSALTFRIEPSSPWHIAAVDCILAFVMANAGVQTARTRFRSILWMYVIFALLLAVDYAAAVYRLHNINGFADGSTPSHIFTGAVACLVPICGIASDLMFEAVVRYRLRTLSKRSLLLQVWQLMGTSCLLACLLVLWPLTWAIHSRQRLHTTLNMILPLNTIEFLLCLSLATLATVMLLHLMVWPILNRSLYGMQALGIARRRWLFGVTGICLLGYAGWEVPEMLRKVISVTS